MHAPVIALHPQAGPSKSRLVRRLLVVNAVLALGIGAALVATASAQPNAARPAGQYLMVNAKTQGNSANAVYIVDSVNREMVVVRWNNSQSKFDGLGYRNLAIDATPAGTGGGR